MESTFPLIIINPAAGGGAAGRDWPSAAATVRDQLGPFDCTFTRAPGDATRIAEAEVRAGRRQIVAFGGDGTVSEIASGIVRAGGAAELGVLPHGTGADFRRTMALPSRLADAARLLKHGRVRRIDVGQVTFTPPGGGLASRYFVNSASFGLSGEVALDVNRSAKRAGGTLGFAASTLKAAARFCHPDVWLEVNDQPPRRATVTQVTVANGRYFGGGMKIAPTSLLADGQLDIIVIGKFSLLQILARIPRLYTGTHLELEGVHHTRIARARAWPVDERLALMLEIDGETPGRLPAEFRICPEALAVRVPG